MLGIILLILQVVAAFLRLGPLQQRQETAPSGDELPLTEFFFGETVLCKISAEDHSDATGVIVLENSLRCLFCRRNPKSCKHIKALREEDTFDELGFHLSSEGGSQLQKQKLLEVGSKTTVAYSSLA